QIITIISNNNAKLPYLKKDEYKVWAMKMEYWIINNDMNIWKVTQNGNSLKRTGRDRNKGVIILPPTTAEEHIAVQRESKARTTLLQSIPDDHVADFHYMDDAKDIWNTVKARFGGNAESKKMRKSMLKQEFLEFRIGDAVEFALMGVTSEVHNCPFGCDNKTKVGLGFNDCIIENELGWDDSAFSVFTTNSEDVEGRPLFHSDKSSDVNTKDFASSDSSVKSSEPKPNDSTSCASTSSVSTSENKAEIESNFVPQAVLLRTSKVNIPPIRPQPVPTGKPKTFLRTPDELSNLDDNYYNTEGDILYLEKLLNEDPSPNLPPVKTKDLKQVDATMTKPSIEEPPELELKELPIASDLEASRACGFVHHPLELQSLAYGNLIS
nr:xylulose kinase-1 [Tanacetum cinerariifolium]